MPLDTGVAGQGPNANAPAREWVRVLSAYRDASTAHSLAELAMSLLPLIVPWAAARHALALAALRLHLWDKDQHKPVSLAAATASVASVSRRREGSPGVL